MGEKPLEQMLLAAAHFVRDIKDKSPKPWLGLLGTSGAGKTHLARRIWRWWKRAGCWYVDPVCGSNNSHRGSYCVWPTFIAQCQGGDSSRIDDLMDDELVILDDVGAGSDAKGWVADKLYRILDARLNNGKPTMFISNMSLETLAEVFDQRIASRLIRNGVEKVVEISVPDFKLR